MHEGTNAGQHETAHKNTYKEGTYDEAVWTH
jgi:hypothetical protein